MENGKLKVFLRNNWALIVIWSVAFVIRIIASIFSKGYIFPDEHTQSIELVYAIIYDREIISWEYELGIRSWVYPGIVFIIFKSMIFLGITDIEMILIAVRLFSAILSMITVVTAYYIGKLVYDKTTGLIATIFISFWHNFIFWSARTMTDSIAMNFIVLGSYFILRILKMKREEIVDSEIIKKTRWNNDYINGFFAGVFFGFAFMFKFPTVIMLLPFFLFLLIRKRWRSALLITGGLVLMVLIQGFIDLFTWGSFLHSPIEFFIYNIWSGKNIDHGTAPLYTYLALIYDGFGEYFLLFLLFLVIGIRKTNRRSIIILCSATFYFIVFSIIPHKEYRFILPVLPFLVIFAAKGLQEYPKQVRFHFTRKQIYSFYAIVTLGFSLSSTFYVCTYQPYDNFCDSFKWVGQQEDSEILLVIEQKYFMTPGYSYLQKDIPIIYSTYSYLDANLQYFDEYVTYIVIPDYRYEKNPSYFETMYEYHNLTFMRFYEGSHRRYDFGVFVYRN